MYKKTFFNIEIFYSFSEKNDQLFSLTNFIFQILFSNFLKRFLIIYKYIAVKNNQKMNNLKKYLLKLDEILKQSNFNNNVINVIIGNKVFFIII